MKTLAQVVYNELSNVKPNQWGQGQWEDNKGRKCVVAMITSTFGSEVRHDFTHLVTLYLDMFHDTPAGIIQVNDNHIRHLYPQPTPKKRIMALVEDMIKAGF